MWGWRLGEWVKRHDSVLEAHVVVGALFCLEWEMKYLLDLHCVYWNIRRVQVTGSSRLVCENGPPRPQGEPGVGRGLLARRVKQVFAAYLPLAIFRAKIKGCVGYR